MYDFDVAVVIGRFEPVHLGHESLFKEAFQRARVVVTVLGSADHPRDIKNPFTDSERAYMINIVAKKYASPGQKIIHTSVPDTKYSDTIWLANVQRAVEQATACIPEGEELDQQEQLRICLVGHYKDQSSYYINKFPQWQLIEVPRALDIDATSIRDLMFRRDKRVGSLQHIQTMVDEDVASWLDVFMERPAYINLVDEWDHLAEYHNQFKSVPYDVHFMTADAVAECNGHILLVQRKFHPGAGTWALPGGFVGTKEHIRGAAIRELREETSIAAKHFTLQSWIVGEKLFDAPDRSLRGRTYTNAYHFQIPYPNPPEVKADDDAAVAKWFTFNEVSRMADQIFEDHFEIIQYFTGINRARDRLVVGQFGCKIF